MLRSFGQGLNCAQQFDHRALGSSRKLGVHMLLKGTLYFVVVDLLLVMTSGRIIGQRQIAFFSHCSETERSWNDLSWVIVT